MSSGTHANIGQFGHRPGEERIVLSNVSWATYEHMLADFANQSSPRLTYNQGILEIMTPLPQHERLTRLIETIVNAYADMTNTDVYCLGSTTFKREDFQRGFEPDSSFYVGNEASVRDKETLDLRTDPPPDLVIETDLTGSSLDKFAIFAQMRVPEVWRHDGTELTIYGLSGEQYVAQSASLSFQQLTSKDISDFIRLNKKLPSTELVKALAAWLAGLIQTL